MDRDKQVGLVTVGDVGTGMQGDEHIGLAGVNHLDIRAVLLHQSSEGQRHIQVDNLLLSDGAYCSGIMSAVSGVNHQRKAFIGCKGCDSQQQHDCNNI